MEVQHTRSGDTGTESVVYTYLLNRGCSEERHYGLRAAEMTALPSNIIQEAKIIASKVSQQLLVWFRSGFAYLSYHLWCLNLFCGPFIYSTF